MKLKMHESTLEYTYLQTYELYIALQQQIFLNTKKYEIWITDNECNIWQKQKYTFLFVIVQYKWSFDYTL